MFLESCIFKNTIFIFCQGFFLIILFLIKDKDIYIKKL